MITIRIRTNAQRRARAAKGDPVVGLRETRRREWLRKQLVRRDGTKCALCGETMIAESKREDGMTIDHRVPLSKGGSDTIQNMQLAHRSCNERKGSGE